ncbi:MAG: chemotaxis-specific protein-glutamate methyltransferase CheB [Promethearchaeota archaeon]|nr:MAG: chemotaxis-specific protein-glutamate methyltransferase CheB [Candidatus Lokiarchaeota archaeon]
MAEDSSFQRKIITDMLLSNEEIKRVEIARNGREAIQKVETLNPDVLILDLMMPEIDGITVFKFLSEHYPIPTIIFTSKSPETLDDSIQALLLGAFDFIVKPKGLWEEEFPKLKEKLIFSTLYAGKIKKTYEKRNLLIKESVGISKSFKQFTQQPHITIKPKVQPLDTPIKKSQTLTKVIAIGTSTGGPRTLKSILKEIPKDFNIPILIIQHLDPYFMKELSKSLNQVCDIKIKIPENGEKILPGVAYLSPGGMHMKITRKNNACYIKTFKGEPVNFCMPSVDVLFFSVAEVYKSQAMGIILTGLGEDGAAGLEAIKNEGGKTIAESEETCVVYGMPKAAVKRDAAKLVIPNYKIKDFIIKFEKSNEI